MVKIQTNLLCDSGVPLYCVLITASISLLTYLSCSSGSSVVFEWFQNLTTIATLFTWCSICLAYIHFHKAMKAQGVARSDLIFRSPLQPFTAWAAFWYFAIIIVFNGFDAFAPTFVIDSFLTAYIGIPIFFGLYFFWKVVKRTKWISPADADIYTGKAAMDAIVWPEVPPRNFIEKFWAWLA